MDLFVFYFILYLSCLLLQGLGYFLLSNWSPNFLLLLVIYISFLKGPLTGVVNGFLIGFFADIFSFNPFGTQSFLFTVISYITGRQKGRIAENNPFAQTVFTVIIAILYLLLYLFMLRLLPKIIRKPIGIADFSFLLGTALSAALFFRLIDRWYILWQKIISNR